MSVVLKGRLATFINDKRVADTEKDLPRRLPLRGWAQIQLITFKEARRCGSLSQPRLWLAVLFAASSPSVQALQVLDARDGRERNGESYRMKEPTRIKVEGAAIGEVFGNVWQDKTNPAGEVIVETDPRGKGRTLCPPVSASATEADQSVRLDGARHVHAAAAAGRHAGGHHCAARSHPSRGAFGQ